MRIGVALPHYGNDVSVSSLVSLAQECERVGFDSVWLSDHLTFDLAKYGGSSDPLGSLEPLVTLAAIGGATTTLRLGTMVLCNEFRHPVQLAKEAAALDLASGGRLELGIGAGWYDREFEAAGIPFPRPGVRLSRLGESVRILRALFDGETVTFDGKHYQVHDFALRPVSSPPIWVGGKGDKALELISSLGQGWNAAWFNDIDTYGERSARVPKSVRRSIGQYAKGSAQEQVDLLNAFATEGVDLTVMCFSEVPFGLDSPDALAHFAADVLPHT